MTRKVEQYRYGTQYAFVERSYPTWEVDVRLPNGALEQRVPVVGPRLPEASTEDRPQWVILGFGGHGTSGAWCIPVPAQLDGGGREGWVYFDQVGNYRISIDREGRLEIANAHDGGQTRIRISQSGNELLLDTSAKVRVQAGDIVEVACDAIRLGEPATEQAVLGNIFAAHHDAQVAIFNAHKHSPSGNPPLTPQVPLPDAALSQVTKLK